MGFSYLQLEDIRLYLISRFQQNKQNILRVESELCPKVYKRLHRKNVGKSIKDYIGRMWAVVGG